MSQRTRLRNIFKELALLLRKNGDRILNGESKLSLTSVSLTMLNEGFKEVYDDDRQMSFEVLPSGVQRMPDYYDLQFLHDFVQKTISLKIIHSSSTLQGRVHIDDFRCLQTLEIKKMPIHLLQGLQRMKMRLNTIICSRCLQCLQDLFESCGGDKCSASTWTKLKTATLAFNSIEYLDASLRLLPVLEVLDLSHNALRNTETHLKNLAEITHINLSYNYLEAVPVFSVHSRTKLKTLFLRNNNLENLTGLEDLIYLEELDVSSNCLTDHLVLQPLGKLHELRMLYLEGNPLSYHANHRLLSIQHVSPIGAAKLVIDGKQINKAELEYVSTKLPTPRKNEAYLASSVNTVSSSYKFEDSAEIATSLRTRKKRKSRGARKNLLDDLDGEMTSSSKDSSRGNSPPTSSSDVEEMRRQIEGARKHQNEYWLQQLTRQRLEETQDETEDDIYLNDIDIGINSTEENIKEQNEKVKVIVHETAKGDIENTLTATSNDVTLTTEKEDGAKTVNQPVRQSSNEVVIDWKTMEENEGPSEFLESVENLNHSDPFIVMLPQSKNQQIIVTVSEKYIHEQNIDGDPLDLLDLRCLINVTPSEQKVRTDNTVISILMPVIHLTFNYVRKDRRERSYIMEDQENLEDFIELLRPTLDSKLESKVSEDRLQCLKCGHEFTRSQAERVVQKTDTSTLPMKLKMLLTTKGDLSEVTVCPQCKSNMVVELDNPGHVTKAHSSVTSTPIGSFSSSSSFTPMATSSTVSTPVKKQDREEVYHSVIETSYNSKEHPHLARKEESVNSYFKALTSNSMSKPSDHTFSHSKLETPTDGETALRRVDTIEELLYRRRSPAFTGEQEFHQRYDRLKSEDSDIDVLSNPSQSSILVLSRQVSQDLADGFDLNRKASSGVVEPLEAVTEISSSPKDIDKQFLKTDQSLTSPCGSLTTSTCSEMVKSVYENSFQSKPLKDDANMTGNLSFHSIQDVGPGSQDFICNRISSMPEFHSFNDTSEQINSGEQSYMVNSDRISSGADNSAQNSMFRIGSIPDVDSVSFKSLEDTSSIQQFDSVENVEGTEELTVSKPTSYLQETINEFTDTASKGNSANGTYTPWDEEVGALKFSYENYSQVDHKLKLHLVMNVLDEDEEIRCVLKCGVVQYMQFDEFDAILIVSTRNIYILKVVGPESEQNLDQWLSCIDIQPITELQYVDIGLHYQSFRLEFSLEFSSYSFLMRDEERCKRFITQLTDIIQDVTFQADSKLQGIMKANIQTLENIRNEVLCSAHDDGNYDDVEAEVLCYCMGYLKTSDLDEEGKSMLSPVSIIVTAADICLASENHQWPLPRLQPMPSDDLRRTQFELKDRQNITDVTQIETFHENPCQIAIMFYNEDTDEDVTWIIVMVTPNNVKMLLEAVQKPWEEQFGVELTIL